MLTHFYNYGKLGSGKSRYLDYRSGNSQGIFIEVLGMNPEREHFGDMLIPSL